MHLTLPFPEALELALQGEALPGFVRQLACSGATVKAEIDLRAVPAAPFPLRALAAIAPMVRVHATFRAFSAGRATFDLTVRAASVPVQRLLNQLTGMLNAGLRSQNLPIGLVTIRQGPGGEPIVVLDLQTAISLRAEGVTVTRFAVDCGGIEIAARVLGFALRES